MKHAETITSRNECWCLQTFYDFVPILTYEDGNEGEYNVATKSRCATQEMLEKSQQLAFKELSSTRFTSCQYAYDFG